MGPSNEQEEIKRQAVEHTTEATTFYFTFPPSPKDDNSAPKNQDENAENIKNNDLSTDITTLYFTFPPSTNDGNSLGEDSGENAHKSEDDTTEVTTLYFTFPPSTDKPEESSEECVTQGQFAKEGCRDYYICSPTVNGTYIKTEFRCPSGLFYNQKNGYCVEAQDAPAECGTGNSEVEANKEPVCHAIGAFAVHGCKDFYTCTPLYDGRYMMMRFNCPEGLLFSEHYGHCVLEENAPECFPAPAPVPCPDCEVICGNKTTTTTPPTTTTTTTEPPELCKEAGRFPVGDGCDGFYECTEDGIGGYYVTYFNCVKGTYFSKKFGQCTPVRPPHCPPEPTTAATDKPTEITKPAPTTEITTMHFTFPPSTTAKPTTGDLRPTTQLTTESTLSPSSTENPLPSTTTPTSTTTTQAPTCTKPGRFALPGCHSYRICFPLPVTGEILELIYSCPESLLFDESKGYCVSQELAPAECRGIVTTQIPTTLSTGK